MVETAQSQGKRTFFGHPWGLANLFGIEVWERFSFYGMQAILLYYLYFSVADGGLDLPKASASGVVGAYGGLVYLSAVLGAWVADRLLGSERTVFYGGMLILIGHICLSVLPNVAGVAIGLVCVGVGSGALKANTTALLGMLYDREDRRADAGFSIFYMGVNIGAFVGPILTGLLHTRLGFHYGFGLAAVGMAVGLVQYSLGRKNFGGVGRTVPNPLRRADVPKVVGIAILGLVVIAIAFTTGLVTAANLADVATGVIVVAAIVLFVVILLNKHNTETERSRVLAFIPMFVASFAFFALFQQIFTMIAIYAQERVDRTVFGFEVPASWSQSVDPIGILIFAPILAALWTKLGRRQPSTPMKFVLGLAGMGVCFLLFLPMSGGTGATSPVLVVGLILLLFSIPELMLSPIGLSLSTKLAPESFRSQMVGLNYLSVAAGTAAAGVLAGFYTPEHEAAYFGIIGGAAIVLALVLAAMSPMVRRLMRGVP